MNYSSNNEGIPYCGVSGPQRQPLQANSPAYVPGQGRARSVVTAVFSGPGRGLCVAGCLACPSQPNHLLQAIPPCLAHSTKAAALATAQSGAATTTPHWPDWSKAGPVLAAQPPKAAKPVRSIAGTHCVPQRHYRRWPAARADRPAAVQSDWALRCRARWLHPDCRRAGIARSHPIGQRRLVAGTASAADKAAAHRSRTAPPSTARSDCVDARNNAIHQVISHLASSQAPARGKRHSPALAGPAADHHSSRAAQHREWKFLLKLRVHGIPLFFAERSSTEKPLRLERFILPSLGWPRPVTRALITT